MAPASRSEGIPSRRTKTSKRKPQKENLKKKTSKRKPQKAIPVATFFKTAKGILLHSSPPMAKQYVIKENRFWLIQNRNILLTALCFIALVVTCSDRQDTRNSETQRALNAESMRIQSILAAQPLTETCVKHSPLHRVQVVQ
jgi:hypothetical protein